MFLLLYITCSCIFMYTSLHSIYFYIFELFWDFSVCFFLPPPLHSLVYVSESWHLSVNLLCPGTLFVLGHPLLLILLPFIFDSMMIKLDKTFRRTFLDKAFIRNAKSFCWTFPTLTYPLSFTVGVGSHYVRPGHMSIHADLGVLL